jgi:hypothetical protein
MTTSRESFDAEADQKAAPVVGESSDATLGPMAPSKSVPTPRLTFSLDKQWSWLSDLDVMTFIFFAVSSLFWQTRDVWQCVEDHDTWLLRDNPCRGIWGEDGNASNILNYTWAWFDLFVVIHM